MASMKPSSIRALIFDLDGTLLDTREMLIDCFNDSLVSVGHWPVDRKDIGNMIGTPVEVIYERLAGLRGQEMQRALEQFRKCEEEGQARGIKIYPYVMETLASLRGYKMAALTQKITPLAIQAVRAAGLQDFFQVVLGGDAVSHPKPAADAVYLAASMLGVTPPECVLVGDTENDVLAGRAAGSFTIAVTWGNRTKAQLETVHPDEIIDDLRELPELLHAQ